MQRLKGFLLSGIVALIFCSGVWCGIQWNSPPSGDGPLSGHSTLPSQEAGQAVGIASSDAVDASATPGDSSPPETTASSLADPGSKKASPAPEQAENTGTTQAAAPEEGRPLPSLAKAGPRGPESAAPKTSPKTSPQASPQTSPQTSAQASPSASRPVLASSGPLLAQPAERMPFSPSPSTFTLRKLGTGEGPTLLVIGGIQGDEPGGFSAAALIASHYTITSGSVWVVPGLNFPSILQRNRGIFGDMNRKFAAIDPSDPEYAIITQIKSVLLDERVSLVLNLHDGSGFYRPTWENALRNPKRWGQSLIIDQEEMEAPRFNQLYEIARRVEADVNATLLKPEHRYHIHNTLTSSGNAEMAKTLSYFAVCNGKPAFGLEASKEFTTEYRSYYHLQLIEAFMREVGIGFERDFPLTPNGVLAALNSNLKVAAYDSKLILDLDNPRPTLNMVPFKKNAEPDVRASKPLLALVQDKGPNNWRVAYGNRTLTRVNPDFMEFDDSLDSMTIELDGTEHTVRMGEIVTVADSFLVRNEPGYRVNAIGAQKEKNGTEAGVKLKQADFLPRYSVDKAATTYRVEVYKGKAFAGMILVRFGKTAPPHDQQPLTATTGPESDLGF